MAQDVVTVGEYYIILYSNPTSAAVLVSLGLSKINSILEIKNTNISHLHM